eukprot:CAMPEP_0113610808 /NCGR_PEP_ID=MMETSP0017_2-20120614/5222_1 /TAXON_ID=2856 /ORGANISM="Cylindrotheca closterium" /LENGTH=904 /DNA_ID=CAMNT_0000519717 /DNA_START=79 /DNA_END=2793 /DNA_ORIENTATION=+ /assembly_acc=CAM_ASM_000147
MSKSHRTLTLRLSSIQNLPENKTCCECSVSNPTWAFLVKSPLSSDDDAQQQQQQEGDDQQQQQQQQHIGAFICYACSTAHKKLGESVGTVKSIAVGSWTMSDVMAMERGGNDRMNHIFEANLLPSQQQNPKPTELSDISERGVFFKLKYGERKFYSADAASRLIPPIDPSPAASAMDSPSLSGRKGAPSVSRQRSLPTLGLDGPAKSPSLSGRRGVRRFHSSDDDDWEPLSPVSIGVYSNSMSTISTKSTLFNNSSRSNRRIQIIKESPVKSSSTGRLSLDSFIESSKNSSDPNNKRNRYGSKLDLNTPPIMEVSDRKASLREFHLDDDHKDTRPKMCQRHKSERTLTVSDLNSQEGGGSRSNKGRRTLSLDSDQIHLFDDDHNDNDDDTHKDTRPKMSQRHKNHKSESALKVSDLHSLEEEGSRSKNNNMSKGRRTMLKMFQRHRSERTLTSNDFSLEEEKGRSNYSKGRRTLSLDADQNLWKHEPPPVITQQPLKGSELVHRRGSMGGRRTSSTERRGGEPLKGSELVHRRGSMGSRRTSSTERRGGVEQQPLSLDHGSAPLRGSVGGRRTSSIERLNRRTRSIDSQHGKQRACLSRRNLSLDSEDIMGSPRVAARGEQRRNSLTSMTESTPQRERPKYTRDLSSSSIMDRSERTLPEVQPRAAWMEGKTPRTTGRRKSIDADSVANRRNSLTGGMMNPLDRSDRSTGSGILRRGRSKRNFARRGSGQKLLSPRNETNEARGLGSDSELRSFSGDSLKSSSQHRRQGLISGDKRPSRGLDSLRSSLGVRQSTDSDLTSSVLASAHSSSRPSSNIAVARATSKSPSSDLASKLHRIDRESMPSEHKSPTSPLTTSTTSKRIPRSLHVVLTSGDGDGDRTFVSTVTGNSSLESHWSLHKERWKA